MRKMELAPYVVPGEKPKKKRNVNYGFCPNAARFVRSLGNCLTAFYNLTF